jgi:zinc transporter, ZIP family
MNDSVQLVILTLIAGITMPLGALIASVEKIRPQWLEKEFRHGVIAFGGGALLSAVALVLVPEAINNLSPLIIGLSFASGGVSFMLLDRQLAASGTSASQLTAMLSDFIPEALALGATFTVSHEAGVLLAGIIALQNLPEGFNAHRELNVSTHFHSWQLVIAFALMALLGPVAGLTGYFFLSGYDEIISCIMLFAAGGILYIIFQDIAPQAKMKNHWGPPLGAIPVFCLA